MHIALPIGKNILMANDAPEGMGQVNENENRSKICISAESREKADKLFNGLSAGGNIEGHIGASPWDSLLDVLETNSVLNGWWTLTQNYSVDFKILCSSISTSGSPAIKGQART
jgi:hypothetical protein